MAKLITWGMCIAVALSLITVCVPRYRQRVVTYIVDEIPSLYPLYQHGIQYDVGTGLPLANQQDMILALSTPKYNRTRNARVYLIGKGTDGAYKVVGQTPSLPDKQDPQGIAVYGHELLVVNHQGLPDSVVIYDLGAAFSGQLKVIGIIPNLWRPTSVLVHDNRLYITCYGGRSMRGQGVYVYKKGAKGEWIQVQRYLYRDLFGRKPFGNDFNEWPDLGPIAIVIKDEVAYVSNQYSGSIILLDLHAPAEKALINRLSGPSTRLYHPLGMAFYQDKLFVAEHIHNYIAEFQVTKQGHADSLFNIVPDHIFTDTDNEMSPYDILAKDGNIFVATLSSSSSSIYVFSVAANGLVKPPTISVPNDASITALTTIVVPQSATSLANVPDVLH